MAADSFEFTVKGEQEFYKKLASLSAKVQKSGAKKAARKGMNLVRNAARRKARKIDDKETALSIPKQIATAWAPRASKKINGVVMRVGVLGGAKSSKEKTTPWYWRLIELGTSRIRAQPFMVPAMLEKAEAVGAKVAQELSKEIDKAVAGGASSESDI